MNYQFRLSEHKTKELVWHECLYYDVETAAYNQNFDDVNNLNIREVGITAFTIMLPKHILGKRRLKALQTMAVTKDVSIDDVEFMIVYYYNDQIRARTKRMLLDVLDIIAQGLKKRTYLCGFNNEFFDDLIIAERLSESVSCWQYHLTDGTRTNLYTADLYLWAKSYGLKKLEEVGEYLRLPKLQGWSSLQEFVEYNIRDVFILPNFLKLLNSHDMYALKPATASRDMVSREMFHKFQETLNIPITRVFTDQKVTDSIPLIGGRTEPYYAIGENVHCLDVNSLYPYTMANFLMPAITVWKTYTSHGKTYADGQIKHVKTSCTQTRHEEIKEFLDYCSEYLLTAAETDECITPDALRQLFETRSPWFGILYVKLNGIKHEWKQYEQQLLFYFPFARKKDGYTLFSYDPDAVYCVQFYELMWLTFFNYEILDAIEYPYFDRFVIADKIKELYEQRKELKAQGDQRERALKMLLNAGYGIFATRQRSRRACTEQNEYEKYYTLWLTSPNKDCFDVYDDATNDYVRVYARMLHSKPVLYIETGDPNQRYANNTIPIYAVAITSHGRFTLYSYMLNGILTPPEIANDYRIYYVDTDSMFCSPKLATLLQPCIGSELGQLKLEDVYEYCYFLAPKTYIARSSTSGVIKKFKGTGTQFTRLIVAQSMTSDFKIYQRTALQPNNPQKRRLMQDYSFQPTKEPEQGSEYLAKLWDQIKSAF